MVVASAIISFNEGIQGLTKVFRSMNIEPGYYTIKRLQVADVSRVQEMNRKSTELEKNRRRKLRGIRKGFIDNNKEKEGVTYSSDAF